MSELRKQLEALVPNDDAGRLAFAHAAIEVVADMLLVDNDDYHKHALEELGSKVYAHGRRYLVDKALGRRK